MSHAGLLGDQVHVITEAGAYDMARLRAALASAAGLQSVNLGIEPAEVTLEDVFTVLTGGRVDTDEETAQ